MHSRFLSFIQKLNARVNPAPFKISSYASDVWEETLLNGLAEIETVPQKCKFGPVAEDRMYLKYKGISEADAERFLKFLRESCGDETATKKFVTASQVDADTDGNEFSDAYHFEIDLEIADEYLYPQFLEEVAALSANPTERFMHYQELSKNDKGVVFYRLLDDVTRQITQLEANCNHDYTKGQLNIIFKLFNNALSPYKDHLEHGCGKFAGEVVSTTQLFEETYNENNELKGNESATALKDDLAMLRNTMPRPLPKVMQLFSLFGPPPSPANSFQSPSPSQEQEERPRRRFGCQIV